MNTKTTYTLSYYRSQIKKKTCWCGGNLDLSNIQSYDHPGGWPVEGHTHRQWLYVVCDQCEYAWALWKLGVPRAE